MQSLKILAAIEKVLIKYNIDYITDEYSVEHRVFCQTKNMDIDVEQITSEIKMNLAVIDKFLELEVYIDEEENKFISFSVEDDDMIFENNEGELQQIQGGSVIKIQKPGSDNFSDITTNNDGVDMGNCTVCKAMNVIVTDHLCKTLLGESNYKMITKLTDFKIYLESKNIIKEDRYNERKDIIDTISKILDGKLKLNDHIYNSIISLLKKEATYSNSVDALVTKFSELPEWSLPEVKEFLNNNSSVYTDNDEINRQYDQNKKVYENTEIPRMMSFIVPEKKDWIETENNIGIKYMGRTYWMKPNDVKFFEDNIGKSVSFKYNTADTIIQFPIVKKN